MPGQDLRQEIANTRKDNRNAIRQVRCAFVLLGRNLGLLGGEPVLSPSSAYPVYSTPDPPA